MNTDIGIDVVFADKNDEIPFCLQMMGSAAAVIYAINTAGDNCNVILYTNDRSIYPVSEGGNQIGWTVLVSIFAAGSHLYYSIS
jgi:hypothetical protein